MLRELRRKALWRVMFKVLFYFPSANSREMLQAGFKDGWTGRQHSGSCLEASALVERHGETGRESSTIQLF